MRHRIHGGLVTARQDRIFNRIAAAVILLYTAGWVGAVVEVRMGHPGASGGSAPARARESPTTSIAKRILGPETTAVPFLTDAMLGFLHPLRGESGQVRYALALPGETIVKGAPRGSKVVVDGAPRPDFTAPSQSGIYRFAVGIGQATRAVDDLSIVTLVPNSRKERGRIGLYYLGTWPFEKGGKPKSERYAPPSGFIEVTRENQNFHVSEHFRLRDFLTKDQQDIWPKYLLLDTRLIDKLELTIQELEKSGVRVEHVTVMSGFRTPRYNHSGGNVAGRANLSRHMYGDAADVFVDNDRNGTMDDINRDGRVNTADAELMGHAVEQVERQHSPLVGGIGVYAACCGHGPFTHIDVRGYRARWRGSGNG